MVQKLNVAEEFFLMKKMEPDVLWIEVRITLLTLGKLSRNQEKATFDENTAAGTK